MNDEPRGPVWERPSKRNPAFLMRLDVTVPERNDAVRVVVDPWTTVAEVIREVGRQHPIAPDSTTRLLIRGVRCLRHRRVSHYTNSRITPATLEIDVLDAQIVADFLGLSDDAAAPSAATDAAPSDAPPTDGDAASAASAAPGDAAPTELNPYEHTD